MDRKNNIPLEESIDRSEGRIDVAKDVRDMIEISLRSTETTTSDIIRRVYKYVERVIADNEAYQVEILLDMEKSERQ